MGAAIHGLRAGLLAVLAGAGPPAWAQAPQLEPSAATICLSHENGPGARPEYPADLLRLKDGGAVNVELIFTAPDRPPRVEVTNKREAIRELVHEVRRFVAGYRVPCMNASLGPVTLRQQFDFVPNDGRRVMASNVTDQADLIRRELLMCIHHTSRQGGPDYPRGSLRDEHQGQVYLALRFSTADTAPQVNVLATTPHGRLKNAALDWAHGLRMPCLEGEPISLRQLYIFKLEGGPRTLLRDLTLQQWVNITGTPPQPVFFDLNTMGCPFDVRLRYYRPHSRNQVDELETQHPARRQLLDWLAAGQLKLPEVENTELLGQEITVSVPCGTVKL